MTGLISGGNRRINSNLYFSFFNTYIMCPDLILLNFCSIDKQQWIPPRTKMKLIKKNFYLFILSTSTTGRYFKLTCCQKIVSYIKTK